MKRRIVCVLENAGFAACLWWWLVGDKLWAKNLFVFAFWTNTALVSLLFLCTCSKSDAAQKAIADARAKGRPIPEWASTGYDVILAPILAATGHFWMAGFVIWWIIARGVFWDSKPNTLTARHE